MREFLHVDDMASASIYVMNLDKASYQSKTQPMQSHINIGTGMDCTIENLVETIAKVVGFKGEIFFDTSKPDGTPRKLLDVSCIKSLGWQASISLTSGLTKTYNWFIANQDNLRQ